MSNKVAFCEQQVGEPGPWGGSVTLEVTDPGKDCGFGPVCGGRNSSRSAFSRCRIGRCRMEGSQKTSQEARAAAQRSGELVSATKKWKEAGPAGAGH